jgi:hypothetical protein
MTLYHVSFDIDNTETLFKPRIPAALSDDEDHKTPRICLTDSIEHCLQAMASEYRHNLSFGSAITVYSIDTDSLAPDKLIYPEALVKSGLVPDAIENSEYWYLENISFTRKIMRVDSFEYNYEIALSCINISDIRDIIRTEIPELNLPTDASTQELYNIAMDYAHEHKMYDSEDNIWDRLAELPYAQKTSFSKLVLTPVAE